MRRRDARRCHSDNRCVINSWIGRDLLPRAPRCAIESADVQRVRHGPERIIHRAEVGRGNVIMAAGRSGRAVDCPVPVALGVPEIVLRDRIAFRIARGEQG